MNDSFDIDEAALQAAMDAEPLLDGLADTQRKLMLGLVNALMMGQKVMNLSAIREPTAMIRYHIADSLALAAAVRAAGGSLPGKAVDIGTGAGFPLLPMAAVWPETQWFGVESTGKKATFVRNTARQLALSNVSVMADRAEVLGGGEEREQFDLATSRAVGSVSALLEVGFPLLAIGGRLYLYKTAAARPEWDMCEQFARELGGRYVGEFSYSVEGDEQQRVIFVAEKVSVTPWRYPRAVGDAFKKPMVKMPESKR